MPQEPKESWEREFVEKGADLEHDRWARWQKYMFSKGTVDESGVFHLPKEFVDRWFRQIDTKYADLSEPEKESDRKETRSYLPLVRQAISTALAKRDEKLRERILMIDLAEVLKKSDGRHHFLHIYREEVLALLNNK